MIINLGMNWENFYKDSIVEYIKSLQTNPFELVTLIIDLAIVIFLLILYLYYIYFYFHFLLFYFFPFFIIPFIISTTIIAHFIYFSTKSFNLPQIS